MPNRVAITGIGIVSPIGLTRDDSWANALAGKSGISHITTFDTTGYDTTFAGEIRGFEPTNYIDRKEARRMDRFTQFAIASAKEAVAQSGLVIDDSNAEDVGVIFGSGIGGLATISEQIEVLLTKGPGRVSPFSVPMMISDMASGQVSIVMGAKGPNYCTTSACSSSADAIGTCFDIILRGDAKVMLAGGAEAPITPIGLASFGAARTLSTRNDDPEHASRPFDLTRDGFVMGEGAACLILEDLEYARARGATILAELVAYAATADAFHITAPSGEGAVRAMRHALRRSGLRADQIDYVNAHGTSTELNDKTETAAIKEVFGEAARKLAISSTKSMTGHLLGGAGALEAALSVLAIQHNVLPPTINYTTPDPECDLDYVPNTPREKVVNAVLSNSFGFGGHNSCLIMTKPNLLEA